MPAAGGWPSPAVTTSPECGQDVQSHGPVIQKLTLSETLLQTWHTNVVLLQVLACPRKGLRPSLQEQPPPGILEGAVCTGSFLCQRPLTDITIDVGAGVESS